MKKLLFAILLFLTTISYGQEAPRWMRSAAISPDGSQIVFTYKGDLYKVSSAGGAATQLTFHEAHDHMAVWSKDGNSLAFASDRYGNFDVFVMSANGGQAKRLTFHSTNESPYSFSADGKNVIFGAARLDAVKHRQFPTGSQPELYTVSAEGGRVDQLMKTPAEYVQVSNDGTKMLYHDKKGGENIWRKHHTSSITRDIWLYNESDKTHKKITSFDGEDRQPIFSEDEKSFFYLSEESGSFNIHKMAVNGEGKPEQLTNFKLHPVRFLSRGKNTLCFGYDGELYTMPIGGQPQKVNISILTQDKSNADKIISIRGGVNEMAVSPNGKEIAFIARGEVFVTSVEESFTKRITNTPENERFVSWGPEGKSVIYSSERNGKWGVYKSEKVDKDEPFFFVATLLKESPLLVNEKDNYLATYSPDGKKLAFVEDRRSIKVKDIASGTETALLTPDDLFHMRDGDKYFTWSPDSKWLLIQWGILLNKSDVLLMAADGSKKVNLNESGYYDRRPQWVGKGSQMIWFSNRNGLRSYATSGRTEADVYSMFFTQKAWDKFNLSDEDFKLQKAIEELAKKDKKEEATADKDKKKKGKKDKAEDSDKPKGKNLQFEWEKMKDWQTRLTIHSSRLSDAVLSKKEDKLYYLASFEGNLNLWSTNLRTKETKMAMKLNARFGSLQWDQKRENLYLLSNGGMSKIDPESGKNKPVKINSEINFDATAETQAIFDHVWIRTNAIFYHPDFHGIDWDQMKTEYSKYLGHIGNSYELTEMLSEMLGELNVSHAGARSRSLSVQNADATASLGIFMNYQHQGNGILIDEVIKGGPLDKAAFDIKAGMIIEKIDGMIIDQSRDVAAYFNRKAGKFTRIELLDPASNKRKSYTVKPISGRQESQLLYKRWVETNRKEVETKSKGKIGYVHIPGMGDGPYRSIFQDMMGKYLNTDGVIVDTRYNGGGDLVADLAMFFTGESFISYETEAKVVGGEPTSRWTKPTLAMINEAQYSDGHCFACGYTDLKIGKTVGMPVPGTCSFAGWEGLPDGSRWGVVPVSAKDKQGKWMENNQTEPDIKVKNMPGIIDNGRDQQLERAIEEMLKDTDK
ncbi:MAG: S41 family peptidase [Bacteroidota bacterium]